MGSWGYEPQDCDLALDVLPTILLPELLDRALVEGFQFFDDYDRVRLTCLLMERLHPVWTGDRDLLRQSVAKGIELLTIWLDDEDFLEHWKEEDRIRSAVADQIERLGRLET